MGHFAPLRHLWGMVGELTVPGGIAATTVADAAAGDANALARIVGAHHDDMARICYVICGDQDMAQDAATPPIDDNILGSSIAVVRTDGSEVDAPRVLTDAAMFGGFPDWSPDGIIFSTYGWFLETTKASNLYMIQPDGTQLSPVTDYGENDTRADLATWTPDGTQITFMHIARNPADSIGDRHIAFIDADGSNLIDVPHWFGAYARMRPTP